MPRLRTVSPRSRGFTRVRGGDGFAYVDHAGEALAPAHVERVEALVIPPAWEDVWICRYPSGHLQAVGTDEAGRRQYLYHPAWREQRDRAKFDRVVDVARRLPVARAVVTEHLALEGMPRDRSLAAAFRLLDLGFFRVGGEGHAEANNTFGLATLQRRHVRVDPDDPRALVFEYVAKSNKDRALSLRDDAVRACVEEMLAHDAPEESDLLVWQGEDGQWHDVVSTEVNAYVKEVLGRARPVPDDPQTLGGDAEAIALTRRGGEADEPVDVSAKDFRTWNATVLAAVALGVSTHAATTAAARKRAVSRAMQEVSSYLGNTPTVARSSYVDPRVIDLFEDGTTIEPILEEVGVGAASGEPATHGAVEAAVLELLTHPADAKRRARRSRVDGEKAARRAERRAEKTAREAP